MNQTEIDELRERIDAAISTVCNGMAAMSIPADPRDVDLVLADCAKALAALEEARAERDKANLRERNIFASLRMALGEDLGGGGGLVEILNGIEGLQDQRDAAESLAWDALGRPGGTHDKTNVQRLCEAHGALKAKLAALVAAVQNSERQFVGWVSLDVGDIDGNEVGVVTDHNKLLAEMRRVALAASRAEESL